MNTPAHAVFGLALLERGRLSGCGGLLALGSIAPDLPNAILLAIHRLGRGRALSEIYPAIASTEPWAFLLAASHSAVVVAVAVALAAWRRHVGAIAFSAAWALHIFADLFTHAADAHPHLWPLSRARLFAPISYWDRAHAAEIYVPVELALVAICAVLAWGRGTESWRRALLVLAPVWLALAWLTGWAYWGT